MEQRDLIKDQIDQLGKVLAKILSDFLGLNTNSDFSQAVEVTNDAIKSKLDIDIEGMLSLSKEELLAYLADTMLNAEHLSNLAEYFTQIGKSMSDLDKDKAKVYFEKAVELLDISDEVSKTTSFNSMHKKDEIKKHLQQL